LALCPKVLVKNNLKIYLEGEVLTTDEFLELIRGKNAKEKGKNKVKEKKKCEKQVLIGMESFG